MVSKLIPSQSLTLLSLCAALFCHPDLLIAAEETHHAHKKHETHNQHQASHVQQGHVHHLHKAGSWMVEYRYMRMEMDQMLAGSTNVAAKDVARMGSAYKNANGTNYMMAPTGMTMDMHMLMAMYSQSDELSWMVMLTYLDNNMDMVAMNGMVSNMKSAGIGDSSIGAMYKLYNRDNTQMLANLSLNLPTGSISKANTQGILPYAMQAGSGSYDLIPSFTYRNNSEHWGWGAQASFTIRLNRNSQNYDLGNRLDGQTWVKFSPVKNSSITARINYSNWQAIQGSADDITMMQRNMSPTFDASNSGGRRLDASLGISHMFDNGHMIGFEYGLPVQQDLNGLQMKTKQMYSATWQYMF